MAHLASKLGPVLHAFSPPSDNSCFYCGEPAATRDHVRPRSHGGSNSLDNLVPACARCNSLKSSHRLPNESLLRRIVRVHAGRERAAAQALGLNPLLDLHQAIPGMPEVVEEAVLLALVRAGGSLPRGDLYRAVRAAVPMDEPTLAAYLQALGEHVASAGAQVWLLPLVALPTAERAVVSNLLELLLTWKARKVRWEKVRARVSGRLWRLEDPPAAAERVLAVLAAAGVLSRSELDRKARAYFAIEARPPSLLLSLVPALMRAVQRGAVPHGPASAWVPALAGT